MGLCKRCKENPSTTYHAWCRACLNAYRRLYDKTNTQRWYQIKAKYGLSQSQYRELYNSQDGKCSICTTFKQYLVIDHNHITGKIRGLLCSTCNRAIGMMSDSVENLLNAVEYLRK